MYSDYPQNPEYNKKLRDKESKANKRRLKLRFLYLTFIVLVIVTLYIAKI